jgi:hypothetical protein
MSGPIIWAGQPGRLEERGGVFMLTLESGDETFRFAMPPHAARRLCETGIRAVSAWERKAASFEPLPLPVSRGRRPKR